MAEKLNVLAFGYTAAMLFAACKLLIGILANFGIYEGAAQRMMMEYMFYTLAPFGIIAGMLEAAIIGFLFGYAFAWIYNKFL